MWMQPLAQTPLVHITNELPHQARGKCQELRIALDNAVCKLQQQGDPHKRPRLADTVARELATTAIVRPSRETTNLYWSKS